MLALLGVQISNDSMQRLYDQIEFLDNLDIEEIGIDDVANRKGQTYATAIYDLKNHHLIANTLSLEMLNPCSKNFMHY